MNTRAKGMSIEALAEHQLIMGGYATYRVKGSTRFQRNLDIFGLFDIIAIKRLVEYTEVRLIQVKGYKVYKSFYNPFKTFKEAYKDAFSVEIWIHKGKQEFEVIMI